MGAQNGTPVNFGFTSTLTDFGITSSGFVLTGHLLQNAEYEAGADKEEVRANQGDIKSRNWYDLHTKATLNIVVSGASKAAAITATTLTNLQPGSFINITACASHPDLVASNWEVQGAAKVTGDVTKSAMISIPLERRTGITAAQS